MDAFKARARQMGGDGVIGVEFKNEGSTVPFRDPTIMGTVIVFKEPGCAR